MSSSGDPAPASAAPRARATSVANADGSSLFSQTGGSTLDGSTASVPDDINVNFDTAPLLSWLFWFFPFEILRRGRDHTLTVEDLNPLPPADSALANGSALYHTWRAEKAAVAARNRAAVAAACARVRRRQAEEVGLVAHGAPLGAAGAAAGGSSFGSPASVSASSRGVALAIELARTSSTNNTSSPSRSPDADADAADAETADPVDAPPGATLAAFDDLFAGVGLPPVTQTVNGARATVSAVVDLAFTTNIAGATIGNNITCSSAADADTGAAGLTSQQQQQQQQQQSGVETVTIS